MFSFNFEPKRYIFLFSLRFVPKNKSFVVRRAEVFVASCSALLEALEGGGVGGEGGGAGSWRGLATAPPAVGHKIKCLRAVIETVFG